MKLSVRFQEPVGAHVALRTGGPCEAFVVAHDVEAVTTVLHDCREAGWKVVVLGRGTRTVVRDEGIDGVVLQLGTGFRQLERVGADGILAGAGLPVPAVLAQAAAWGLAPRPEQLVVPGSFGASVVHDDWDVVEATIARPAKRESARVKTVDAVARRSSAVVLSATVRLEAVGQAEAQRRFLAALSRHPNPPGSWVRHDRPVRGILRKAALDNVRLRAVEIPEDAPELLINLGGGTARDLKLLHRSALERVKRTRGLELESVVNWVGQG